MEEWRIIKDHPNFMVSSLGRVKSVGRVVLSNKRTPQYLKERIVGAKTNQGYVQVTIDYERIFVHRLVAQAFIPNPENKPYIDHINTIRNDNRVENLRWVTPHENNMNAKTLQNMKNGRKRFLEQNPDYGKMISRNIRERVNDEEFMKRFKESLNTEEARRKRLANLPKRTVEHLDANGILLETYRSVTIAAKSVGKSNAAIVSYCRGKRKPKDGSKWRYKYEANSRKFFK